MTRSLLPAEIKATLSLSSIYIFRMLGLFMILPVFAPYGLNLRHATPLLVGLAFGIYGLSQGLLQIPFGILSDKIGRKRVIFAGLLLFMLGSIVAACSQSIEGVMCGRCLQGAGAIGSSLSALLSDLTRDEVRTKAMAILGMSIGLSFFIAVILGPLCAAWIGVQGIFGLTAVLALLAMVILQFFVPTPRTLPQLEKIEFKTIGRHKELWRLNIGIFLSHAILTSGFMAIPFILLTHIHLAVNAQAWLYLPVLLLAFLCTFPCIMISETRRVLKQAMLIGLIVLALSQIGLYFLQTHLMGIAFCLFIFFTAFSFFEATLPSLVSKIAPAGSRGSAMGIFSAAQFLGIFFGGLAGGYLSNHYSMASIFIYTAVLAVLWFFIALRMKQPLYLSTKIIHTGALNASQIDNLKAQLLTVPGVKDVAVIKGDTCAHLKVDKQLLDTARLDTIVNHLHHTS